jgi:hypothetical protein
MSHTDGAIDNSLSTWINTHQAQLNAQPAGFVPLATADADMSNVAVIEDDGTCLFAAGASTSLDHIAIVEKFYQTHADLYDFLLIFSAAPVTNGSIFKLVHNVTTGTTVDLEDNRDVLASHPVAGTPFDAATGAVRNLKAITQYVDLTNLPLDPNQLIAGNNDTPLSLIAQEIGHYWGMAAPFATVAGGATNSGLQGRGNSHWSFFAHTQASSMEGNSWLDNGGIPNSFTSNANTNGYFPFDLYLMGLLNPALTPSTFYIQVPSADTVTGQVYVAGSTPVVGANITGTRANVTATQLTNALGNRNPDFNGSQKDFKTAFILVVANGATAPANAATLNANVAQVNGYRTAWETYWNTNTLGASTMDTALSTPRNVDIYVRDNLVDNGLTPSVGGLSSSPDIIVRKNLSPDPATEFGVPDADPGSDPVEIGNDNYIYVRVHNRGDHPADADVSVFFAPLSTSIDPSLWTLIDVTTVNTVVPGGMGISGPITWPSVPDPGGAGHFCLIAIISDPLDPAPDTSSVVDVTSYLDFVRDNNNVAYRNLTFEDVLPDSDSDTDFLVGAFKKSTEAVLQFDGAKLPKGYQALIVLPADWKKLEALEIKGFDPRSKPGTGLILHGGANGVIGKLPVKSRSRNRVKVKLKIPKDAMHGQRGLLDVIHHVEKQEVGRVAFRTGVIARQKARYLGVIGSKLFYSANDPRVIKLPNKRLKPFKTIGDALNSGYDPGKGFLVDVLGPKAVSGKTRIAVLDRINRSRGSGAFLREIREGLGQKPKHYSHRINSMLFAQKKYLKRFSTIVEVYESIGFNGPAFMELINGIRKSG